MLRVVLAVSNFLETPNGGGAGGNRQPAGASSLRERCDSRATTRTARQTIREPWHCGHANTDCLGPKLQRYGAPGRRRFTQIHKPL